MRSFFAFAAILVSAELAHGLPGGRAWMPTDTLKVNGHAYMFPSGVEVSSDFSLWLIGRGLLGPGKFPTGFTWADSMWRVRWVHRHDSYLPFRCASPGLRELYIWRSFDELPLPETAPHFLLLGDLSGDSLATPDTLGRVLSALFYSGAASATHEWAAAWEEGRLRVFDRLLGHPWRERQLDLNGDLGVTLTALDDSTALVVTAGGGVLRSAIVTPSRVVVESPELAPCCPILAPLRPDGEGGHWLVWSAGFEHAVARRRLASGTWLPPDTLSADFVDTSDYHVTNSVAAAQDQWPRPAISWMVYGRDGVERIYVSWPTATGWTRGQFLPGTEECGAQRLAMDENGDIWIAWWKYFDGIFWTHSFATATCSAPALTTLDHRPHLRWVLSAPAEGTWWAVMRAVGDAELERVARVPAGSDTVMTWADSSAPAGVPLRYAIRRECRDVRYQWTSEAARWEPRSAAPTLVLRSGNPASFRVDFEVFGSDAGGFEARLFDLQGRVVARTTASAAGAGRDGGSIALPSGLRAGLYLLRVRVEDGRESPAIKIAVVR